MSSGNSRNIISRIRPEIYVKTSRSGGPGGQHANKTETRVQLIFDIARSQLLTDSEKSVLIKRLKSKLTKDGVLIVASESSRSQVKNRENAFRKLHRTLNKALVPPKKRKPTKPTKASIKQRLKKKKLQSEKKKMRGKYRGPLD